MTKLRVGVIVVGVVTALLAWVVWSGNRDADQSIRDIRSWSERVRRDWVAKTGVDGNGAATALGAYSLAMELSARLPRGDLDVLWNRESPDGELDLSFVSPSELLEIRIRWAPVVEAVRAGANRVSEDTSRAWLSKERVDLDKVSSASDIVDAISVEIAATLDVDESAGIEWILIGLQFGMDLQWGPTSFHEAHGRAAVGILVRKSIPSSVLSEMSKFGLVRLEEGVEALGGLSLGLQAPSIELATSVGDAIAGRGAWSGDAGLIELLKHKLSPRLARVRAFEELAIASEAVSTPGTEPWVSQLALLSKWQHYCSRHRDLFVRRLTPSWSGHGEGRRSTAAELRMFRVALRHYARGDRDWTLPDPFGSGPLVWRSEAGVQKICSVGSYDGDGVYPIERVIVD